jgi:hypothetical protein
VPANRGCGDDGDPPTSTAAATSRSTAFIALERSLTHGLTPTL